MASSSEGNSPATSLKENPLPITSSITSITDNEQENNNPIINTVIVIPEKTAGDIEDQINITVPSIALNNGLNTSTRKMMTNLTKRPPALLQYSDLVYTVKEKSGRWFDGVVGQTKTILKGNLNYKALFAFQISNGNIGSNLVKRWR